ncbi:MAG: hypothetical protein ACYDA8_22075 [Deferrisomatales bacterium]
MRLSPLSLALVLLAAQALALGRAPEPVAPAPEPKSSLQLIAEALERGELDQDAAVLYRVYSVKDDAKLPERYRSAAPIRDGTPVLRDARDRYEGLRPETREALRPYLFPRRDP